MLNQIPPLFQFAYVSKEEKLDELASIVRNENWRYRQAPNDWKYPILYNYTHHTFARVHQQNKIAYGQYDSCACFNTGLLTDNGEPVFGFFVRNRYPNRFHLHQKWFLKKFCSESDRDLCCIEKPPRATYFDTPQELIFNPDRELVIDLDHLLLEDHLERFPSYIQTHGKYFIKTCLNGAFIETTKLIKNRDVKAVPEYYGNTIPSPKLDLKG